MAPPSTPARVFSGWRVAGLFNTILIWIMTIIITSLLISSAWRLGSGWPSLVGTTMLFRGDCATASRTNLSLHIALNAIATLVLASSNAFMQVLCAPTRSNVDSAHRQQHHVDIGVQSLRNLWFIPRHKVGLWLLLALTSVPLHLYFNSSLSESRASTDMFLFVATEGFLAPEAAEQNFIRGLPPARSDYLFFDPNFRTPGCFENQPAAAVHDDTFPSSLLSEISRNASVFQWKNLTIDECLSIYDDPDKSLTLYRHAILVVRNESDPAMVGWDAHVSAFPAFEERTVFNTLWSTLRFKRTDEFIGDRMQQIAQNASYADAMRQWEWVHARLGLDPKSRNITINSTCSTRPLATLQAAYCLAEPWVAPCELHVQNLTLMIVCIFCLVKSVVCLVSIILLRHDNPLITPGDAIESFIAMPDPHTEDMCWTSQRPERVGGKSWWRIWTWIWTSMTGRRRRRHWAKGPRQWKTRPRRLGSIVPWYIWLLSYACTGYMIGSGLYMTILWVRNWQPWSISTFGPSPGNGNMEQEGWERTYMGMTFRVNLPQLEVSITYLCINAILTRMHVEREWVMFGRECKALRVSHPKGAQRSTYRLQLPYRWSIPLMVISGTLHWLISNCIYPQSYISFSANYPYRRTQASGQFGIGISVKAIVAALIFGAVVASIPLGLALVKLPGNMVVVANNSAVISAACHGHGGIPPPPPLMKKDVEGQAEVNGGQETIQIMLHEVENQTQNHIQTSCLESYEPPCRATCNDDGSALSLLEASQPENTNALSEKGRSLYELSIGKLKWGVVSPSTSSSSSSLPIKRHATFETPGRLAFGAEHQVTGRPVDGDWYA